MINVGIDIGKRFHICAIVTNKGIDRFKILNDKPGVDTLLDKLGNYEKSSVTVGMEASGHYWYHIYNQLLKNGYQITVINPHITDAVRRMNIRPQKTDRIDSVVIAKTLSIIDTNKETTKPADDLKVLTRLREDILREKMRLKIYVPQIRMERIT